MSSGLRPNDTAWRRTSSRYCFMPSMPLAVAMIESACLAAKARPRGEPPACTNTGLPCGERTVFSGPRHLEVLALEVDRPDLAVVGIGAGRAVHHHRVGVPRVEQFADQIDVFVGHLVALFARRQLVEAEILRRGVLARGDDVPAEPPAGDVVQRRAEPRQHERRIGQRGHRRDDAQPRGRRRDQRGERRRIVLRHLQRVLQRGLGAVAIGLGHHQRVLDHDVVEAGALQRLRHVDVEPAVPGRSAGRQRAGPIRRA